MENKQELKQNEKGKRKINNEKFIGMNIGSQQQKDQYRRLKK